MFHLHVCRTDAVTKEGEPIHSQEYIFSEENIVLRNNIEYAPKTAPFPCVVSSLGGQGRGFQQGVPPFLAGPS